MVSDAVTSHLLLQHVFARARWRRAVEAALLHGTGATCWPNPDALRRYGPAYCLLAHSEAQPDLHQSRPTGVQVDRFGELRISETATTDRDRTTDKVRRHRAAMHAESLGQLHVRRPRLIQGHQLVHLRWAEKGLSHPNCTHLASPRVHYGWLQRRPVPPVNPPRPARSHGFKGRAGVLELSTEVHSLNIWARTDGDA